MRSVFLIPSVLIQSVFKAHTSTMYLIRSVSVRVAALPQYLGHTQARYCPLCSGWCRTMAHHTNKVYLHGAVVYESTASIGMQRSKMGKGGASTGSWIRPLLFHKTAHAQVLRAVHHGNDVTSTPSVTEENGNFIMARGETRDLTARCTSWQTQEESHLKGCGLNQTCARMFSWT